MGFYLSLPLWLRSSPVLVGGTGGVGVACPLEGDNFGLEFVYLPL